MCQVLTSSCCEGGVQSGAIVWRPYCAEHGVLADGQNPGTSDDGYFFEETNDGLTNLFDPEFLFNGKKKDGVNNFAREHYTVGKEIIDKVNDRMRKLVDNCDNVQGFVVVNNRDGGGTYA